MMIRCIAIDDEPLALEKMESYISKVPFLHLEGLFTSGLQALQMINQKKVDLIFLDIQMEDITGIQLLEIISHKPKVILTTAYDSYAIKSYELDVADYLLKPISFERFLKAVTKVYESLSAGETEKQIVHEVHTEKREQEYIFVKTEHRMQKVFFKDIMYIEGMKDYLRIVTHDQRIMTLLSFKKVEEMLPAPNFIRVHKSFIVAIDKIESIERSRIKILDMLIPVGENYRKEFFDMLEKKSLN
jgi:DNA-binding LytR/AlgR family response regulator